jgi:phosphoglycolate phosphatase
LFSKDTICFWRSSDTVVRQQQMNLLFDLDGTLTDPFQGITKCIMHALIAMGRPSPTAENLRWCIGPPLKNSFLILLDSEDDRLAEEALAIYQERFGTIGLFENELYPDIHQALGDLARMGHGLFVATSKPSPYAERIVEHFGLQKYFQGVYGSDLDGTRSDKSALISYILQQESIASSDTIMIGDRKHDVVGAKANGLAAVGVLWGYGTKDELDQSGADICASSPRHLVDAVRILGNQRMQRMTLRAAADASRSDVDPLSDL